MFIFQDLIILKNTHISLPRYIITISTLEIFLEKFKYRKDRASLVAQWWRICLPMQGTRVRALVWEDPTCRGAIRPVSHNC